jgi:PAS domain S-box-containing protein
VHAIPWAVVGAALFVLAAIIFKRQRASRVAVLFCLMIVLVGIWFISFAGMFLSSSEDAALPWARLALAAVCFLPAAIYDFTVTALRLYGKRRAITALVWTLSTAFALLAAFSDGLAGGMQTLSWGFYPVAGRMAGPFLFFFFAVLIGQLVEGFTEYRRSRDPQRGRRIARMLSAFAVVYLGVHDFLPMIGVPTRPVGYLPVLAFIAVAWTTIRRHRFQPITAARASREILETMADALIVIDAEGRVRVTNGAVRTLLGYGDPDLLGRSIDAIEQGEGDASISRTLRELSRRGPIRDQERVLRHKNGHSVDVSVSISPVSERDVQQGAVVIARDIRERKRAEEELRETLTRLEQSNRELEDFAYVASHDLQEPLRKIQAFGDLLKSKHGARLEPQAADYIDRMQSAARRMQVLINDLLTFSRVTTKAQPFVAVDLGHVAREVAKDLEVRTHETGAKVVIGELPTIDADPLQMRQLLQNLVSNALKFHRPDVPPVVEITGAVAANGRARLTVADNGIGFEEKYADRIFTMFERLHGRGKYEGTGIGLAICRKIAERHGGEIRAHSRVGEGSTFVVYLPARHAHHD